MGVPEEADTEPVDDDLDKVAVTEEPEAGEEAPADAAPSASSTDVAGAAETEGRTVTVKSRMGSGSLPVADGPEVLGLPSDCGSAELDVLEMRQHARLELPIRIARAFKLLKGTREAVKHMKGYLQDKAKERRSQAQNTRAQTQVNKARDFARRVAQQFNHNYNSIVRLRRLLDLQPEKDSMEARLRWIRTSDLFASNLTQPRAHGERARAAWIWGVFELPSPTRQLPDRKGKAKATDDVNEQASDATNVTWEENGKTSNYSVQ